MRKSVPALLIGALTLTLFVIASAVGVPESAFAQEPEGQDADALARKLSNPAAANWSLSSNFDFIMHAGDLAGAGEETSLVYSFQPGLPKTLSKGNLLFRPLIPVFLSQTVPGAGGFESQSGLGDIAFDLAWGNTNPETGLLTVFGLVGTLPTNTMDSMPNLWSFGPELMVGLLKKWGVIGVLVSQQWDVESGSEERNILGGQYFYAFSIGNGWQIAAGPTWSYNWLSEQLTLPVATGIAKTLFLGSLPLKLSAQAWYYIEKPEVFGNDFQFRFSIAPVIPALW